MKRLPGADPSRTLRVLIADDNAESRSGLKALLETSPRVLVVGQAADGLEAVRLADRHRPDVALIDVRMPILDGLDATRRIKERWPGTRVVAISMCGAFRVGAAAAGADAFLVKGGASDELMAAVVAGRVSAAPRASQAWRAGTADGGASIRARSTEYRRRRALGLPPPGARPASWLWATERWC